MLHIEPEILAILTRVNEFLSQKQIKAYLVGGFIRDLIIDRPTADIDIAVAADALQVASGLAEAIGGRFVPLDETNKVGRVVIFQPENTSFKPTPQLQHGMEAKASSSKGQWYVDLSTLAGDIHQDLARRDFTINAMAIDLESWLQNPTGSGIIDPFNGQADLEKHLIRAVDETVFEADPARLLRAVRLSAELNFSISPETEALIQRDHSLISRLAGERVRDELVRILATNKAGLCVRWLDNLRLLTAVIPQLETSRGVEQPKEHHWDVLNHSLETVRAVDFLLRHSPWEYADQNILNDVPWSEKLEEYFAAEVSRGSSRSSMLKLGGLLHDIAKPETKIIANARVRFFGHTEQGAEAVAAILERLRFTNKEIKLVELMVRNHMRPTQMSQQGMPTQRAIYRYFRDTGTAGIDILFLSLADHLAARGPELDRRQWKWHTGQVNFVLTECLRREEIISPPKLIDGHDLINIFNLKPGPGIREILEAVREAQAAGEISSRDEALSYVKNRLL